MRSYRRASSDSTSRATASGVRKLSPAGRIASCASWAFFTLPVYTRGLDGTYSEPYISPIWLRAVATAVSDNDVLSVRI